MVHIPEETFIMIFGGVEAGGGGIGILPGGHVVHIGPRDPEFTAMVNALAALAPAVKSGVAADAIASLGAAVHIEAVAGFRAHAEAIAAI